MRKSIFRDMSTAPRNATPIEVKHGPEQVIVLAEWSGQAQAWILVDDPHRKTLHRVTGWRPVKGNRL